MKPIEKVSIMDRTVESITEHINTSEYRPGEKLPSESVLSRELNVGRSTVREALRVLQARGLIEIIHGKGAYVAQTPPVDRQNAVDWFAENKIHLEDLMNVRLAIEQMSMKLATQHITAAALEELRGIQEQFVAAVAEQNVTQMALLDELYHSKICESSDNTLLVSILQQVSGAMRTYRLNSFAIPENCAHAVEPHQAMLEALEQRSIPLAMESITAHIQSSLYDMRNLVATGSVDQTVF